jgi:hypothetical protein
MHLLLVRRRSFGWKEPWNYQQVLEDHINDNGPHFSLTRSSLRLSCLRPTPSSPDPHGVSAIATRTGTRFRYDVKGLCANKMYKPISTYRVAGVALIWCRKKMAFEAILHGSALSHPVKIAWPNEGQLQSHNCSSGRSQTGDHH